MFEILWKAGDITWLPYYQIEHLQVLDAYLDLWVWKLSEIYPVGKENLPVMMSKYSLEL